MYDLTTRKRVLSLLGQGYSLNTVSKQTGISRSAIRAWRDAGPEPKTGQRSLCPRCTRPRRGPEDRTAYAYLLGLYLGDGCISRLARTYSLRIACADAWPGLIDACEAAMTAVRPDNRVNRVRRQGCTMVTSHSNHWPCLFPQHGPGRKHERRIVLEDWQREIVDGQPWEFVRGLIHSDGCRVTNWTTRTVGGEPRRYEYPRYFFTNASDDIRGLFTRALDGLGVEWRSLRQSRRAQTLSIARRGSVALMDAHVGAKF
ncbi:transcriptional regulator [Streptomyces aidingensis]|uniref:transcriptional regulator n=1 Tax=Streptomyces aidingensis TaxID=910347 RepID=UPI000B816FC2|nr:transcriptional regulator [Streptomyces aidingensis]